MEKKEARLLIRKRIDSIPKEERTEKSRRIAESFLALPEVTNAGLVMAFASLEDEVDTMPILEELLSRGSRVALPVVVRRDRSMLICEVGDIERELALSDLGIPEPSTENVVEVGEIDVVCTPGRAFDSEGNRLGRGGAYYDIFFSNSKLRATRIAIAFHEQLLPSVPHNESDQKIDILVTDKGTMRFVR